MKTVRFDEVKVGQRFAFADRLSGVLTWYEKVENIDNDVWSIPYNALRNGKPNAKCVFSEWCEVVIR